MNTRSSISSAIEPQDVIGFWRDAGPKRWFKADAAFDAAIHERFAGLHNQAAAGLLSAWEEGAPGALALILVTDQFARNLYRQSAHAFATDELARNVADRALARGLDQVTEPSLRFFFYMPFEHHEDAASQARGLALFEKLAAETGDTDNLKWARLHQDLIMRFGRFPHRNAVMGRLPTKEETDYLAQGGFAG